MNAVPQPREVRVGNDIVGVYEYGDKDGRPVLVFHGVPACGAGFAWADEPARARGLRLIAPDRPGVGLSTGRAAGYAVKHYPPMMSALADTLGIGRFAVFGYSGGGPYAVACAMALPERVTHAAVAAGVGQVGAWATLADFAKTDRQFMEMAERHPRRAAVMLSIAGRAARLAPRLAMKSFAKELSTRDRAVLEEGGPPAEQIALFTQAFLRGAGGVVADYQALAKPWGFDVGPTPVPVSVWHGDADTMVPLAHSRALVDRMPSASMTVWQGEGHLGTISHIGEIFDAVSTG